MQNTHKWYKLLIVVRLSILCRYLNLIYCKKTVNYQNNLKNYESEVKGQLFFCGCENVLKND